MNQPIDPPTDKDFAIARDILDAYLRVIGKVDSVLFRGFLEPSTIDRMRDRLERPYMMSVPEWDSLSTLLQSVSMSFSLFRDGIEHHDRDDLHAAIDRIMDYAHSLPDEPEEWSLPPGGGGFRYEL